MSKRQKLILLYAVVVLITGIIMTILDMNSII